MENIIIAILGSGVLSTLISGLFSMYNNKRKSLDGVVKGVQMLLRDQIDREAHYYLDSKKCISVAEKKVLTEEWDCYHNELGGNGHLDGTMARIDQLPLE